MYNYTYYLAQDIKIRAILPGVEKQSILERAEPLPACIFARLSAGISIAVRVQFISRYGY